MHEQTISEQGSFKRSIEVYAQHRDHGAKSILRGRFVRTDRVLYQRVHRWTPLPDASHILESKLNETGSYVFIILKSGWDTFNI